MANRRNRRAHLLLEEESLDWEDNETERQLEEELRHLIRLVTRHVRDELFVCVLLKVLLDYAETLWEHLRPVANRIGFNIELEMWPDAEATSDTEQ